MNEEWKDVCGFEGLYKINKMGDVFSCCRKRNMKQTSHQGYQHILLQKEGRFYRKKIHRLIFEAFIHPIPKGMQIDHIDRNRQNNEISNLRCVNGFQNQYNRNARRTFKKGNKWGYATRVNGTLYQKSTFLTEEEAYQACEHTRGLAYNR